MKFQFNKYYLVLAHSLFLIELAIAFIIKTGFIRYTFGDYLVVILLYAIFRGCTNLSVRASAFAVLFIAYGIEDFSIDFEQMPSCQELIQKMNEESLNSIKPFQAKMDFDMETINRELAVERADRNRLFDFLQLRYRGPHDNFFNERFSIGVGLKMDKKNSSLLKLKELELDKQQLETEQVYEEKAYASERTSLLSEAQKIFEEYQFFLEQSKSEKEKLNQLSKSYTQMNGVHPQFLLDIREREIRLDLEALSYEEQLYEIYLDFLELTQYFIYSEEKAAF